MLMPTFLDAIHMLSACVLVVYYCASLFHWPVYSDKQCESYFLHRPCCCAQVQSVREVSQTKTSKRFMFEIIMSNGKRKMLVSHYSCALTVSRSWVYLEAVAVCVCVCVGSGDSSSETEVDQTPVARHAALSLPGVRTQTHTVSIMQCYRFIHRHHQSLKKEKNLLLCNIIMLKIIFK